MHTRACHRGTGYDYLTDNIAGPPKAPGRRPLGCDDLFERDYVAVGDDGTVLASVPNEVKTGALLGALARIERRPSEAFEAVTVNYFAWRRNHTFQGQSAASQS